MSKNGGQITFQFAHLVGHFARFDAGRHLDGQFAGQLAQIQLLLAGIEQRGRHLPPHRMVAPISIENQLKMKFLNFLGN